MTKEAMAKRIAELVRQQTPVLSAQDLTRYIQPFIDRRDSFLNIARSHGSPLYLLDETVLRDRARQFKSAFEEHISNFRVFYAMKSNNCPLVSRILVEEGLGLDVSSGVELREAIAMGVDEIIFSGPGKTEEELRLAVHNSGAVTVLMDSFGELKRLEAIAAQEDTPVKAGIRVSTQESGIWRKFGIPLAELRRFFDAARDCKHIKLCGIQFHISWNLNPENQVRFLSRLGATLRDLPREYSKAIEFVDIGGGFWPPRGEWLQPAATAEGILLGAIDATTEMSTTHHVQHSSSLDNFATKIGDAVTEHLQPVASCRIIAEPGRWLSNDAMHILLTVIDRKDADLVITDGGINAVGWERYENDYCPVINMSNPSTHEQKCLVAGSLCTPHDIWGYSYFGENIQAGDILLIPNQGAYTYSLRQQFIKAVPDVVILKDGQPSILQRESTGAVSKT